MSKKIVAVSRTGRVQTSASGATFVNAGTATANEVLIINASGTTIDVKVNSATSVPLATAGSITVAVASSLAEIQVKRSDDSNTQVYVHLVYTEFLNKS